MRFTTTARLLTGVGLISFAACALVAIIAGTPPPWGHDGFSYLLAGDTFAHGRLANPSHPLWVHFESFHILQQPTYASKYPPAQGLALALGQVVCGHPIVGVWLTTALASAAVGWMLLAWMPPRWALLGALLVAFHPIVLLWSRWYSGGAIGVLGGALVLGGARRGQGWWMGIGMSVLALSRPYEGAVWSLICLGMYRRFDWRLLVPVAVTAIWLGYYDWRVTGHPLRLPYVEHETQYGIAPAFVWMKPRTEPAYRHEVIREFHRGGELSNYECQQTLSGFLTASWKKLVILGEGLVPLHLLGLPMALIVLGLVPLWWAWRDVRVLLAGLLLFTGALLAESWINVHYAAPALGGAVLLAVTLLRQRPMLVRVAVPLCAVGTVVAVIGLRQMKPPAPSVTRQQLLREPGKNLVIVRYAAGHSPEDEWVYNAADIATASIVWAREMADNSQLLDYFRDRRVWLLEADAATPRLVPYPVQR